MNPEITLRPHQRNAIAHVLYGNNVLPHTRWGWENVRDGRKRYGEKAPRTLQ